MRRFTRKGSKITAEMTGDEVAMLASLTGQLIDLTTSTLGEPDTDNDDPLARLERELAEADSEPPETSDPVIERLFPNPYPHDPKAAAEYRRYSRSELRDELVGNAERVLQDLSRTKDGRKPVTITGDGVEPWLKLLGALRLSLATRLGVTDAESVEELAGLRDDDPRSRMYSIFEWLGFAQETLVESL